SRATPRRRSGTVKRPSSSPSDHGDSVLEVLDDAILGLRRISDAGLGIRFDEALDLRCASIWCASCATVGAEKKLRMEIDVAKAALTRESVCTASSESPPSSKKSLCTPTRSTPSTSPKI